MYKQRKIFIQSHTGNMLENRNHLMLGSYSRKHWGTVLILITCIKVLKRKHAVIV